MGIVFGILIFFGLCLASLIILAYSYFCSQNWTHLVAGAVVATVLVVLEYLVIRWFAGIGSATSGGQGAYKVARGLMYCFVICLVFYFWSGSRRIRK